MSMDLEYLFLYISLFYFGYDYDEVLMCRLCGRCCVSLVILGVIVVGSMFWWVGECLVFGVDLFGLVVMLLVVVGGVLNRLLMGELVVKWLCVDIVV